MLNFAIDPFVTELSLVPLKLAQKVTMDYCWLQMLPNHANNYKVSSAKPYTFIQYKN